MKKLQLNNLTLKSFNTSLKKEELKTVNGGNITFTCIITIPFISCPPPKYDQINCVCDCAFACDPDVNGCDAECPETHDAYPPKIR